jgi:hypothetical protein
MHTDASEITLNIALNNDYDGCALRFCGVQSTDGYLKHQKDYAHKRGYGVIHPGKLRHRRVVDFSTMSVDSELFSRMFLVDSTVLDVLLLSHSVYHFMCYA